MLSYDPRNGAYISSLLVYRGSGVIQRDIVNTLVDINKRCKQGKDFRRANGIENPFQVSQCSIFKSYYKTVTPKILFR